MKHIAAAYSLPYYSAERPSELSAVIAKVLATKGSVICEIFSAEQQEIIPTVSSQKLADGRMISKPLDDMYPFMDDATRTAYLKFE